MNLLNRVARRTLFAIALVAGFAIAGPTLGAVPGTMVIEGLLTSTGGGAAADGLYDVTFSIYNVQSGGTAAWTEPVAKVAVKNGQFSYVLGNTKPLSATLLTQLTQGWLGMKVASDPELPRQPLHSVAYAVLADTATKLSCSGCLGAGQLAKGAVTATAVGFNYAGSKTKGGPASSASDLSCTGCVSVAEMKFDKDVDLGGNALKAGKIAAKDVVATTATATTFIGDGSKLTGIKIPSGECKSKGEVVKGINPDGTLKCVAAMDPASLPADGIDEISNYLIHNQFVDKTCGKTHIKIPDNNPTGVADELTFPDIGLAQKLDIDLTVTNSNLADVTIKIYDPNNVEYTLIGKSATGKTLTTSFPSKTKPANGDLTSWVNKNPKGKWRILAVDDKFLNNTTDGEIVSWCVRIQTLSNKKVQIKGKLIVDGDMDLGGSLNAVGGLKINGETQYNAFPAGSRPFLYGFMEDGMQNNWIWYDSVPLKINYPYDVAVDNQSLHRVVDQVVYGNKGGNVMRVRKVAPYADSTDDSQMILVAFIKNITKSNINHKICWRASARDGSRRCGLAVNKSNVHTYSSNGIPGYCDTVTFKANQTNVLVLKAGAYYWTGSYNTYHHRVVAGFYSNSFDLPTGLVWDYQRYTDWMANK